MAIADFLNQLMISLVSTIHRLSVHTDVNGRVFNGKKITPCLWFDGNAEEAVNFYTSVFKNSKILEVSRYTDAEQCGWLRDRFGVSRQIIPSILGELMQDKDRIKSPE